MSESTAVAVATHLPVGTWRSDPTHSSASFAVKHMAVSTFRGGFDHVEATLSVGDDGSAELVGLVRADSIVVKDENLRGHLGSPEFFDVERYPELRFVSSSIRREGEDLILDGELTICDQTHSVEARGTITDPTEGPAALGGAVVIGLTLETIIDRTAFGLSWNAPLPKGGVALANDVKLTVELELARADAE